MACTRCLELEQALQEALATNEVEELEESGLPKADIDKFKKAVRVAQARARAAEKESKEIVAQSKPVILELTKWRHALDNIEEHCDEEGQAIINKMYDWYAEFILG